MTIDPTSLLTGLVTGLALIVAIGAQNAYVLGRGLTREHVGPVVAVCAISDLLLIVAGVAGVGTLIAQAGWVLEVVRWLGVAFLVWYGVSSLRQAARASSLGVGSRAPLSRRTAVLRALALTWLNPHVYLDTVLVLGTVANREGDPGRWWFAVGAGAASILWFTGLGYGARLGHGLLTSPRAWQVLDVLIGLTMLAIALRLATG